MKRILAVILTMAMVLGIMPASLALNYGGVEIAEEMYFEFSSPAHGFTGSYDTEDVDGDGNTTESHPWRSLTNEHNADMASTDSSLSDPWRFVGNYDAASLSLNDAGFAWSFYLDEPFDMNPDGTVDVQIFDPNADHHIRATMFELQCSESGEFVPVFNTRGGKAGAVFDVYFVKKQEGDTDKNGVDLSNYIKTLDRKYCIGTIDTYHENDKLFFDHKLEPVNITAGNYYVILIPTGINEEATYAEKKTDTGTKYYPYSSFKSITFEPRTAKGTGYEYVITTGVINKGGEYGTEGADANGMPWSSVKTIYQSENVLYKSGSAYSIYNVSVEIMDYLDMARTAPWTLVDVVGKNSFNVSSARFHMNALNGDNTNGVVNTTDRFRDGNWAYAGFRVTVPTAGKYSLGIKPCKEDDGAIVKFYALPASANLTRKLYNKTENYVGELSFYKAGANGATPEANYIEAGTFEAKEAGDYYIVAELRIGEGEAYAAETTHTKIDVNGDGEVNSNDIYLRYLYEAKISGIRLTAQGLTAEEQEIEEEREAAKNVNADNAVKESAVSRDSEVRIFSSVGELIGTESYTAGGEAVTLNASEYTPEGYEFLYWAKGIGLNKHAVCDTAEYTFIPEKGLMNLTAVFRKIDSEYITVEFYNMNRALVKRYDTTYKIGDEISMEALPFMTGLGRAKNWILANDNSIYGADDKATASGKAMIFVADYDIPESNLLITVNGGTLASGEASSEFAYGDAVTVTAKKRTADGMNHFAYWMRGDEIVSFDTEYTFNAYKSETITAVYSKYEVSAQEMRKIVVDSIETGDETSLIAEFIIDDEEVIERGFVFGSGTPTVNDCSYKSAMTTDKKQFSIVDDSNLNVRAYAILRDGVIYSK